MFCPLIYFIQNTNVRVYCDTIKILCEFIIMAHQPVYNIFKALVAKNILEHNMDLLNFGKGFSKHENPKS